MIAIKATFDRDQVEVREKFFTEGSRSRPFLIAINPNPERTQLRNPHADRDHEEHDRDQHRRNPENPEKPRFPSYENSSK